MICSIVYGSRFEYDDTEFVSLIDKTNSNVQLAAGPLYQISFHIFINIINTDIAISCDFNKCNATIAVTELKIFFFYLKLPDKTVSCTDMHMFLISVQLVPLEMVY